MNTAIGVGRRAVLALAALLAVGCTAFAASGQDIDQGKRIWSNTAACTRCHGWAGNGAAAGPGYPTGANLRNSKLERADLKEVIQCGKPGSEMPSFARAAWGTLKCFGMTAADVGDQKPMPDGAQIGDAQIEALLDYLYAKVVGRPQAAKADCEDYFGAGAARCAAF